MIGLIARLLPRLGVILDAFLRNFGPLIARAVGWFALIRFGWLMVKVGILLGLITGVAMLIDGAIDNLVVSMPPLLADGFNRTLPDNFSTCVSAIVMTKFAVFALSLKDRLLSLGGV